MYPKTRAPDGETGRGTRLLAFEDKEGFWEKVAYEMGLQGSLGVFPRYHKVEATPRGGNSTPGYPSD